jgi:hypothetical protein
MNHNKDDFHSVFHAYLIPLLSSDESAACVKHEVHDLLRRAMHTYIRTGSARTAPDLHGGVLNTLYSTLGSAKSVPVQDALCDAVHAVYWEFAGLPLRAEYDLRDSRIERVVAYLAPSRLRDVRF